MKLNDREVLKRLYDVNRRLRMFDNFDYTLPWVSEYIEGLKHVRDSIVRGENNHLSPFRDLCSFQYEILIYGGEFR